jgi:hypothetical protein
MTAPIIITPLIIHPGATGVSETVLPILPQVPANNGPTYEAHLSGAVLRIYVRNDSEEVLYFGAYPPPVKRPWWKFGR